MTDHNGRQSRTPYLLVPVFVVLAAGLVTAGYFYHRNSEEHFRQEVGRQLSAIAKVKAHELTGWGQERLADAAEVYEPLRERPWATVVVVGVLLLGAAGGAGLLWRQQRVRFYRERYGAAEALRESEAKYRTLVENIPQKVFMKTRDSRYVSVNESYARDLGVRPEDAAGKTDYDFFPKELADKYRADDRRVMETGQTEELEEKYPEHGKETWVQTVKTPVRDVKGEIVGLLGVFWDITERKRMEHELRRLAVIAEQAAEGIAVADLDGNLQFVNHAWARMHGYESGAELVGKHLRVFHTDEQMKTQVVPFNAAVKRGGHHASEVGHVRRDGTTFPTQMSVVILKDERGEPYGMAGFAEDITHRKRAQEELQEANRRLKELATTDELTGLWNRRRFAEILALELERAKRRHAPLALAMFDIDQFKSINDTYGHAMGDRVLKEAAKTIQGGARGTDVVARYGGDEFMIVMPDATAEEAVSAAERVRKQMAGRQVSDGTQTIRVSLSAGISAFDPATPVLADALVHEADGALYAAKHSGRDCTRTCGQVAETDVAEGAVNAQAIGGLRQQVAELSQRSREAFMQGVRGLVQAQEARDPFAKTHSENIARFAAGIAQAMRVDANQVAVIRRAALLHDIGKIGVPDGILWKPGPLTPEERMVMQQHVLIGVKILDRMRLLDREVPIVRHHHERWDGHGYPDGISGEAIPLGARILAVADAFDAITSDRPYRQARPVAEALRILQEEAGRQFDPGVVDALVQWVRHMAEAEGGEADPTVEDLVKQGAAAAV